MMRLCQGEGVNYYEQRERRGSGENGYIWEEGWGGEGLRELRG